jgi:hypothetical protein
MIAANSPAGKAGKPEPAVCSTCGGSSDTGPLTLWTFCGGCQKLIHDSPACIRSHYSQDGGHAPLCAPCAEIVACDCGHSAPFGLTHIDNAHEITCHECYKTWLDAQLSPFATCPEADDARWAALLHEFETGGNPEKRDAALDRIARAVEALAPTYGPGGGPSTLDLLRRSVECRTVPPVGLRGEEEGR